MVLVSAGTLDRFGAWSFSCSVFLALSHTCVPSPRLGRFGQYGPRLVPLGCLWYSACPKIGCFCRSADPLPLQRPALFRSANLFRSSDASPVQCTAFRCFGCSCARLSVLGLYSVGLLRRFVFPALESSTVVCPIRRFLFISIHLLLMLFCSLLL